MWGADVQRKGPGMRNLVLESSRGRKRSDEVHGVGGSWLRGKTGEERYVLCRKEVWVVFRKSRGILVGGRSTWGVKREAALFTKEKNEVLKKIIQSLAVLQAGGAPSKGGGGRL